jgi:predicted lipoprotein with Yx(FWY)xxD motif
MEATKPVALRRRRPHRARLVSRAAAIAALGVAMALAMAGAGPAAAAARRPAEIGAKVILKTATVHKYGRVLVTQKGHALYYNKDDSPSHWACTGACLALWPPLTVPRGETLSQMSARISGLGTVAGLTGLQVTWHGRALYTFSHDTTGTVKGEGADGVWFVAQLARPPAPPGPARTARWSAPPQGGAGAEAGSTG